MKLEMTNFQAVAANLVAEGDVCDLACAKPATQPETDTEIAPIIQKLGATSMVPSRFLLEFDVAQSPAT